MSNIKEDIQIMIDNIELKQGIINLKFKSSTSGPTFSSKKEYMKLVHSLFMVNSLTNTLADKHPLSLHNTYTNVEIIYLEKLLEDNKNKLSKLSKEELDLITAGLEDQDYVNARRKCYLYAESTTDILDARQFFGIMNNFVRMNELKVFW